MSRVSEQIKSSGFCSGVFIAISCSLYVQEVGPGVVEIPHVQYCALLCTYVRVKQSLRYVQALSIEVGGSSVRGYLAVLKSEFSRLRFVDPTHPLSFQLQHPVMSQSKQQQQQTASTEAAGAPLRSESQSLFNIYYLGNTVVDRRCSSSVMPWIIEEMKIKAAKMRFLWLTPGKNE